MIPIVDFHPQRGIEPSSTQDPTSNRAYFPNDATRLSQLSSQLSGQIIASALDILMGWEEGHSLAARGGANLRQSIEDLPLYQRDQLFRKCDPATLDKLFSLSRERNPDIFLKGLNGFSSDLGKRGEKALAAGLLGAAQQAATADPAWRNRIDAATLARLQRNLDELQGESVSLESVLQGSVQAISSPANLAGFALGQAAFRSFRFMTLARLSSSTATTSMAARALAVALGVAAEAPALTLGIRAAREVLGESQGEFGSNLVGEMLENGISLSLLHLGGFASQRFFESFHGVSPLTLQPSRRIAMVGVSRALFPQVGTLGAMMLAGKVEAGFKGQDTDFARLFAGSFAMLAQSYAGGRLFEELQPRSLAAWSQGMEMRSRILTLPRDVAAPTTLFPKWNARAEAHAHAFPLPAVHQPRLEKVLNGMQMVAAGKPDAELPPIVDSPAPNFLDNIHVAWKLAELAPIPVLVTQDGVAEVGQRQVVFANAKAKELFSLGLSLPLFEKLLNSTEKENIFMVARHRGEPSFWKVTSTEILKDNLQIHYLQAQNLEAQTSSDLLSAFQLLQEQYAHILEQNELHEIRLHDVPDSLQTMYLMIMSLKRVAEQMGNRISASGNSALDIEALGKLVVDLEELRVTAETAMRQFHPNKHLIASGITQGSGSGSDPSIFRSSEDLQRAQLNELDRHQNPFGNTDSKNLTFE